VEESTVQRDTLILSSRGPIGTLESLDTEDKSLWIVNKRVLVYPNPSPHLVAQLSVKPNALADKQDALFKPVSYYSRAAFVEKVYDSKFLPMLSN
jgi:hypothetical protein